MESPFSPLAAACRFDVPNAEQDMEVKLTTNGMGLVQTGRLTDDKAIEKFKEILDVRRQVEAGESVSDYRISAVTSLFEKVARDVFEPIARYRKLVLPHGEFFRLSLNDKRAQIANLLYLGVPILEPGARFALMYALLALNAGADPPLFRKTVQGQGINPDLVARARLDLLKWVHWQMGCGVSRAKAEQQVASVINRSPKAVAAWENALAPVFGADWIQHELKSAYQVGGAQAEGVTYAGLRPSASARDFMLQEAWVFERNLNKLAEQLKAAQGKRKVP